MLLLVELHKVSVHHDLEFLQASFISPLSTDPCYGWVWHGRGRGSVPHLLDFPQKTVLLDQTVEGISVPESLALCARVSTVLGSAGLLGAMLRDVLAMHTMSGLRGQIA